MYPRTLNEAVGQLIASLSTNEREILLMGTSISPLIKGGSALIGRVMKSCALDDGENAELLRDIATENPGQVINMDFLAEMADPTIAATLIIEAAQRALGEDHSPRRPE